MRHGFGQYLQIRFRHGDGKAQQEADQENQRQLFGLRQR